MRSILVLVLAVALVLSACGPQGTQGIKGDAGSPGAPGTPAPTPTPTPVPDSFEGFYVFPDAGYMEIVKDSGSLSDINQLRLSLKNADGSVNLMPIGAVNNLPIQNNKLYYITNFNYVALTHNVKTDVGATALVGSFFTYVTMSKSSGVLTVRVQIVSGTSVVYDHSVSSL